MGGRLWRLVMAGLAVAAQGCTERESETLDCTARPIAECVRGVNFADCGGDGRPTVYCRDGMFGSRCLWFEGGCPATEYTTRCDDPDITEGQRQPKCAIEHPAVGWGNEPWTRDRAMVLRLQVDTAIEAAPPEVSCGPCGRLDGAAVPERWGEGQCLAQVSVCDGPAPPALELFRADSGADWGPSALVALKLFDVGYSEHTVLLELDFERSRARLCVVQSTDTPTAPGLPACADDGLVVVDRAAVAGDGAELHGEFDATFPTFTVVPGWDPFVTGLRIQGRF